MSRATRRSENKKMFNKIIKHKMIPILEMELKDELLNCLNEEETKKYFEIMQNVIIQVIEGNKITYCTKLKFKEFQDFEKAMTEKYKDDIQLNKIKQVNGTL